MRNSKVMAFAGTCLVPFAIGCSSASGGGDSVEAGGETSSGDDTAIVADDTTPTDTGDDAGSGEAGDDAGDAGDDAGPAETGATQCTGTGVVCGQRVGLDTNKLYKCVQGSIAGEAQACKAACIASSDQTPDRCPCPDGDGRYCGDRVGGTSSKTYDCKAGIITEAQTCGFGCTAGSGPNADHCSACRAGNGAYCGQNFNPPQDDHKLYQCTNGVVSVKQDCAGVCVKEPDPTPDHCGDCGPSGNGLYCGGPVHLDPNVLYNCTNGVFTVSQNCASTCHVAPPKTNDYCEGSGVSCSHIQWWNTALTYGPYMSYGWWDTDLAVSGSTPVQLRHASQLYKTGVYGWGYMPEFIDQVTGKKFRFLHLRPQDQWATNVGQVYPAGYVVGLSGGDTWDTGGAGRGYSTGAHLCVQTLDCYRCTFPAGQDTCH